MAAWVGRKARLKSCERFDVRPVRPGWPAERKLVEEAYRSLDFPFAEIAAPPFSIEVEWNLLRLLAYLSTWSAVKRFIQTNGTDPLPALAAALAPLWGGPERALRSNWPLFLQAGHG